MLSAWIHTLRGLGVNRSLFDLIAQHEIPIDAESELCSIVVTAAQNGITSAAFMKLMMLDAACALWVKRGVPPLSELQLLCVGGVARDKLFGKIAEVIAGGILGDIFPRMSRIPERADIKTPDYVLEDDVFCEVYCPQESSTETDKYANWLRDTVGPVKIFKSRPTTGSSPLALLYPTNVIIDRAIGGKRDKNQFTEGAQNLLWIDLLHGFEISSRDTMPYSSISKGENTYVGSFGLWHSLYGDSGCSFVAERTDLRYFRRSSIYKQQRRGLFRERTALSAALLLLADGIVLFENPWASTPLSQATKQSLKRLVRFAPEMSFLRTAGHSLEARVSATLAEIEWLYSDIS
jgi:hypothetical protein